VNLEYYNKTVLMEGFLEIMENNIIANNVKPKIWEAPMNNPESLGSNLKLYVKYTLKDIKEFSYAKASPGIFGVANIFIYVLLAMFLFVTILFLSLDMDSDFDFLLVIMMLPTIIVFICAAFLPRYLIYSIQKRNFIKSKSLNMLQCIEFKENGIEITSESGNFFVQWNDILKIKELKPCFLITIGPYKSFLLPRRCFESQAQLDLFFSIVQMKLEKKKLKLKRYRLKRSEPDRVEIEILSPVENAIEERTEPSLLKLDFNLTKNDLLSFNFSYYYRKPVGILLTALGILLIVINIKNLIENNYNFIGLFVGIGFTFIIPLYMYYIVHKQFKKDSALTKKYSYDFYNDFYIVTHPSGTNRISYKDLVKITETKNAFSFFVTTQIAHVIPKRVFADKEYGLEIMKSIVEKNKVKK
jgi:hypothetical protein